MASSIFLTLVILCLAGHINGACIQPWIGNNINKSCYLFHNITSTLSGHTWEDSQKICHRYGGDLLSIADQKELDFISKQFQDPFIKRNHYWIGLNDIKSEGVYTWSDGTTSTIRNWNTEGGEPNNWKNEDCVEATWNGKWNDNGCFREFGFICKRLAGATPMPTPTYPPRPNVTNQPTTCEAGWLPWRKSCYGIIRNLQQTWKGARADCLRRFGDLVIINDQDEQDFLTNEIAKTNAQYWIGLSDVAIEKTFYWVDSTKVNYTNWGPKEPSNEFGNEDCVEMYGKWNPGKWNDNYCLSKRDYICEKQNGLHNCPEGWISFDDHCYQINSHPNQRTTWKNARNVCLDFNKEWEKQIAVSEADLTSITSQIEQDMLVKAFKNNGVTDYGSSFWTGLSNITGTGLAWSDKTKLKFQNYKEKTSPGTNLNCVKSSLDDKKGRWLQASCEERNYYACKVKKGKDRCYSPMGIQNYAIPDASFTASGVLSLATPPAAARLYLQKGQSLDGAWCESNSTKVPWLQINFGKPEKLTYMGVQGKYDSDAYVTEFYLKYSNDGVSWDTYGDIPPAQYFKFRTYGHWRVHQEVVMNLRLPSPLIAQYVRIYPMRWVQACCMRVEFYGCGIDLNHQQCGLGWVEDKASRNCYKFNTRKTTWDAAQSICKADGGDLLSITTTQEMNYIKTNLKPLSRFNDFWIGLNDLDVEGFFKWNDHSPLLLTSWYTGQPKKESIRTNCVSMRSQDGDWMDQDCTSYRSYICKKKYQSAYIPKEPFNSNWISGPDYYWPLDVVTNGQVFGTFPAQAYGNFGKAINFPFPFSPKKLRYALSFDGKRNYLKFDQFSEPCATHPASSYCTHGITVSLLFNKTQPSVSSYKTYLLNSLSQSKISKGYYIYLQYDKLYVYLSGDNLYYTTNVLYNKEKWNHVAFTWSRIDGLKVYINGELKGSSLGQTKSSTGVATSNFLVLGKSISGTGYAAVSFASLAIFEKVLAPLEVKKIYNTEFGKCRWGQIAAGSFCYEFNSITTTWSSAKDSCRRKGGDLMSVHSPDEQALLSIATKQYGLANDIWIGLSSHDQNHVYKWTDGSPVSFTYWNKYEPNNWNGRREDCVHTTGDGYWNDDLCYLRKAYACKYPRVYTPKKQDGSFKEFTVKFYRYQTKSFGCPLGKEVNITKVQFGSVKDNCLINNELGIKIVEKNCKRHTCSNIRSSDSFFNNTPPCLRKVMSYNKRLTINYTCPEDTSMVSTLGCVSAGYSVYLNNAICYRLYLEELNVTAANERCEKDNGKLASIESQEEELFITTLTRQMYKKSDIWIGMKYDNVMQRYSWMNNKPVVYTNWYNKQPDPRLGKYVSMRLLEGPQQFMYWKPTDEAIKLPFLCRKLKVKTTEAPTPTVQKPNGSCPTNWTVSNNHCIKIITEGMSFVDAQEACSKLGRNAMLASIMNYDENRIILRAFEKSGIHFAWLGLTNEAIFEGFSWIDGNPLSYINWYTGRPNTGQRHLCAGMSTNGKWWDLACYARYSSVCKIPIGYIYPTTTPATTTPATTQDPTLCKTDWRHFNGSCYYFTSRSVKVDFHAAKVQCEKMGSHLTSIWNKEENMFLKNEINRRYGSTQNVYIGLTDRTTEGGWAWEDQSIANYFNFDDAQPDNWHGMEDCTELRQNGKWNDLACNLKKPFICKQRNGTNVKPNTTATPDTGYCKNGWVLYGKKCYLFKYGKDNRRNFNDARAYCEDSGGSLVSIHSNYENAFILSQLAESGDSVFIGLNDLQIERTFLWLDQSTVDYTNWYLSQPSRYSDEDCVELMPFFKYHGRWNDINCQKETGFVCQSKASEKKPTDKPTVITEPCPKGYKKFQKSCYIVHTTPKTWLDARRECKKVENGDLVSLHSPHEQAFVFSRFVEHAKESWIGLHKVGSKFVWSDNTTRDYEYWKPGFSSYSRLKCAAQVYSSDVAGKWKTYNCSKKLPFSCKITRIDPKKKSPFLGNCSDGWKKVEDRCLKYFSSYSDTGTWPEAREKCKRYGGDLVTIDSEEIQSTIRYMIRNTWRPTWIGLNDRRKEHVFEWSSGQPLMPDDFSNWGANEPNDNSGSENCVEMTSTSGKWNDLPCYKRMPFVCEHTLECRSALGMESMAIPDDNITATSYADTYFPSNARLNKKVDNKDTAWCTNITDKTQSLTIFIGSVMKITRINTQGLYRFLKLNNYVITYMLEYSLDGKHWKTYTEEEADGSQVRYLPGNKNSRYIEGTTVDIEAMFLRFTPIKFKGSLVCLRVELYGCKSVCLTSLGMDDHKIASSSLSASSTMDGLSVDNARPMYNNAWCAKTTDSNPWLKIDLLHDMKLTRVLGINDDNDVTYYIQYSSDDKNWMFSNTLLGAKKQFSSKTIMYDLEVPVVARYVKFLLTKSSKDSCLQVELFGCASECDIPLGLETKLISDTFLSASSSLPGFAAKQARLNGDSAWCAMKKDGKQYLQIDFQHTARITGIATQGFIGGGVEKFVTEYEVQWSADGKFWTCLNQDFIGNTEGKGVHKVKLEQSLPTRYLRIVPTGNVRGICMRVELYGCAVTIQPTLTPLRRKQSFYGSVRLTSVEYNDKLAYENSLEYEELSTRFEMAVSEVFSNDITYNGLKIRSFKPGSVVVNFIFVAMVSVKDTDPLRALKYQVTQGKLGEFTVDKSSLKISTSPEGEKQESSDGISNGTKVGLIVFFLLLIILILIGGGVYYCKRHNNGFKLAFAHKSFENPVHMSSSQDEMNIEFVNHPDDEG